MNFARAFEGWHLLIIAIVVLILFGSKKMPEAARSFGRSLRIFKAETKGLRDDDSADRSVPERPVDDRTYGTPPHGSPQPSQHVPLPLPTGQDTVRAREATAAEIRRDEH